MLFSYTTVDFYIIYCPNRNIVLNTYMWRNTYNRLLQKLMFWIFCKFDLISARSC